MFRVPLGTKCRIYGNYEKILNLYLKKLFNIKIIFRLTDRIIN